MLIHKIKANDGHDVDSELEKKVDNLLNRLNLTHEVHPSILNSDFQADFKVGDVFVEVWGIKNNVKYETEKKEKLNYYNAKGLGNRLVELKPEDCKNVRSLLKKVDEIKSKMSHKQATVSSKKEPRHIQYDFDATILAELLAEEELEPIDTEIKQLETNKKETELTYKTEINNTDIKIKKLKNERMTILKKFM